MKLLVHNIMTFEAQSRWMLIGSGSIFQKLLSFSLLGFDLIFKKYSVLLYRFCHYFQKMIGWFLIGWGIFLKNARLGFNRFCVFFEKMIGFSIIGFTSFLKKCSVLDYRFCNRSFLKMIGFSPTDENIANRLKKNLC